MRRPRPEVIHGDPAVILPGLMVKGVRADLVYMDPPFCTGRDFHMPDGRLAFSDKWGGGPKRWLAVVREVAIAAWATLRGHGHLVVHVDPRGSHVVRGALDAEFGEQHFASEVVWRYRRWPTKSRTFQAMHDTILVYRKDATGRTSRWNQLYEPLAPSTIEVWGTRGQRAQYKDGKRNRSASTDVESPGAPMSDVWDIPIIAPSSRERTGFPTQKPEALLERIVTVLSDSGDLVIDPCMGSGTTLAVARRMGRRSIGVDPSAVAVHTAKVRLEGGGR